MTERNWRTSAPKWAVEAAESEIAIMKRRLALRWPDEARPTPVEFSWGEYDRLDGKPVAGDYWTVSHEGRVYLVQIREPQNGGYRWRFSQPKRYGDGWTNTVQRGPLYATEQEAKLAALWAHCDRAAAQLEAVWSMYNDERGYL